MDTHHLLPLTQLTQRPGTLLTCVSPPRPSSPAEADCLLSLSEALIVSGLRLEQILCKWRLVNTGPGSGLPPPEGVLPAPPGVGLVGVPHHLPLLLGLARGGQHPDLSLHVTLTMTMAMIVSMIMIMVAAVTVRALSAGRHLAPGALPVHLPLLLGLVRGGQHPDLSLHVTLTMTMAMIVSMIMIMAAVLTVRAGRHLAPGALPGHLGPGVLSLQPGPEQSSVINGIF